MTKPDLIGPQERKNFYIQQVNLVNPVTVDGFAQVADRIFLQVPRRNPPRLNRLAHPNGAAWQSGTVACGIDRH